MLQHIETNTCMPIDDIYVYPNSEIAAEEAVFCMQPCILALGCGSYGFVPPKPLFISTDYLRSSLARVAD
jgi:hypothetical protein